MKRVGGLYDKIISIENLYLAEKKTRRGKSKKKEIIKYIENLDENILELHKSLFNETYVTSEYSCFTVYEPKKREISKLPYRDRVLHHALMNYLEEVFERSFISQTYSCIKGRGIHGCLKQLTKYLKDTEGTKYCLKLDIKKFYPSVDNEILKKLLRRKFKDKRLLCLLDNIIDSINGLPLGSYISQWLANFYLNGFCHWLKEVKRIKYLQVYCDDILILSTDKEYLHSLRRELQEYLLINLKLELSNYQVFNISKRGIDFVGYVSRHSHILLRKSIKERMKRKLNNRNKPSYFGWCVHANTINLQNKYFKNE